MGKVVLSAKNRQESGSAASRRIRRSGRIPAVLYGRAGNAIPLDLDALEFVRGTKNISERSEERRVGKECRSRWSPYH